MFNGGRWLNTYELKFFKNTYLESLQYNNWTVGGIEQQMGEKLKKLMNDGLSMDFPTTPSFKISDMGATGYSEDNLSFSFYLINKSTDWLERNFKFLQAFYAGTQWLSLTGGFIKSPNVYHVLCPGRFQIFWASIGTVITYEGKLRKNEYMNSIYGKVIKSITSDTLWPDAWKIDVKIKDLTPNNFNTYAEYFVHGFGQNNATGFTSLQALDQTKMGLGLAITGKELNDKIAAEARAAAEAARAKQDQQFIATYLINQEKMTNADNSSTWNALLGESMSQTEFKNLNDNTANSDRIREYNMDRRQYLGEALGEVSKESAKGLQSSVKQAQAKLQQSTEETFKRDEIDRATYAGLQQQGL